ncbi:MAG TPA: hypothetical protein VMS77_07715 [Conexivisphaerales archaeon]|nr:hypothetical protein [Conexivisphaerales archaeon]
MTQLATVHLYRCVLEGDYFNDKETAVLHLRIYHGFSKVEDAMLKEVDFPTDAPEPDA